MDIDSLSKNPSYKQIELDYVEFAEVDDIWVRAYTVPKSKTVISQHVHTHDHVTLVSRGTIECWQDGEAVAVEEGGVGGGHGCGGLSIFRSVGRWGGLLRFG
jgi:hypothetical protein